MGAPFWVFLWVSGGRDRRPACNVGHEATGGGWVFSFQPLAVGTLLTSFPKAGPRSIRESLEDIVQNGKFDLGIRGHERW